MTTADLAASVRDVLREHQPVSWWAPERTGDTYLHYLCAGCGDAYETFCAYTAHVAAEIVRRLGAATEEAE